MHTQCKPILKIVFCLTREQLLKPEKIAEIITRTTAGELIGAVSFCS
jgi:hypothetical protein